MCNEIRSIKKWLEDRVTWRMDLLLRLQKQYQHYPTDDVRVDIVYQQNVVSQAEQDLKWFMDGCVSILL